MTRRTAPDAKLAAQLGAIVDEPGLAGASLERLQGEFKARHSETVELYDRDLDFDGPLDLNRFLLRAVGHRQLLGFGISMAASRRGT